MVTATKNIPDPQTPVTGSGKAPTRRSGLLKIPRTRMGGVWVAFVIAAFVLLLLLIFVLQNGQSSEVSFLGAHGTLPMGVALLLAAVFGVLLVALPGTARILQLRALERRRGPSVERPPDPERDHR